ncbi:MAG: 3-deoxy-D-manno-octulosonic acid transferase [Deltaproteobacteria bacterium]|nr:3-deoxy-D-manno-octulosonic acid transferase [Deltaproteobacteria bacterium]
MAMTRPFGLIIYQLLSGLVFLFGFPFLLLYNLSQGKFSESLVERLGRYPYGLKPVDYSPDRRPVWVHAVSVGEVKVAVALVRRIQEQIPDVPLLLSTTTPAGRETAEKLLGKEIPVIYYPLDFYLCVKRALKFFRPQLFIGLETELWPNFLYYADRLGSRLVLVNGRLSERSFKNYLKLKWFFSPLLKLYTLLLVRQAEDAVRFEKLGAPPDRVRILGNIKFDGLADQTGEALENKIRRQLKIPEGSRVLVAGSTRSGEEEMLAAVFERLRGPFPDLRLILAPRHLNRVAGIEKMLVRKGLAYALYSRVLASRDPERAPVILVDRMGDLFALYSLASLVFCGASLVPKGGQNILEAAAWGKPVFYGPSMEDFRDARELLEAAGAGIPVRDPEELARKMEYFLEHPEEAGRRGAAGRQALASQQGVTRKAAAVIAALIKKK